MKQSASCPLPKKDNKQINLSHGDGGSATESLINDMFRKAFSNCFLDEKGDGAILNSTSKDIAFSTDSFVVKPIFFPGGDIGSLSVNGTVNDILCCGATPLYLSAAFIIEEGFAKDNLRKIVDSMSKAAKEANVYIVTGDTKVVERGKCDGIYITTSGIGSILPNLKLSPRNIRIGDLVIVTAPIGAHGIAILSSRENLGFDNKIKSDTASLRSMVTNLLYKVPYIRAIRDATRGGVATVLNEMAEISEKSITIDEIKLPIEKSVSAAAALLGLEPLYIANEGVMVIFVAEEYGELALEVIRQDKYGEKAAIVGRVTDRESGTVFIKTTIGTERILPPLTGEQLPRIC